jgi:PIN domain nuclease of toxin-antitoxin system
MSLQILDTHALLYDALTPEKLSATAARAIEEGDTKGNLAISDITLWEISMLVAKDRLKIPDEILPFLKTLLLARSVRVLPITPEISTISQFPEWTHNDPADRLIAATAIHHRATLVTRDAAIQASQVVKTVW